MHFSDIGVFLGRCEFAKVDFYTTRIPNTVRKSALRMFTQ